MTLQFRVISAIIFVAVLLIAILSGLGLRQSDRLIDQTVTSQLQQHLHTLSANIEAETRRAETLAVLVSGDKAVIDAMASRDRQALSDRFVDIFRTLNIDMGVAQFQFHLPPAISFLRVHKPEKWGDDLSGFRHTIIAAHQTKKIITGIEQGVAGLGIRAVVPITDQGQYLGSVEFGISLGESFFLRYSLAYDVQSALVFRNGDIYASTFASKINDDPDVITAKAVLNDYSGRNIGDLVVGVNVSQYQAAKMNYIWVSLGALSGVILIIIGQVVWLRRDVITPLEKAIQILANLGKGEAGMAIPKMTRQDEIGMIYESLSHFQENLLLLQKHDAEEKKREEALQEERKKLLSNLGQTLSEKIGKTISKVGNLTDELQTSAGKMQTRLGETARNCQAIAEDSENVLENMMQTAHSAEEISASVSDIGRQTDLSKQTVVSASEMVQDIDVHVIKMQQQADKVGDVAGFIASIAENTNLLALNATIEAARAGEAGKGFSVVASEVKGLATETARATKNISSHIEDMQSAVSISVSEIGQIDQAIRNVQEAVVVTASAVVQQDQATDLIAAKVEQSTGRISHMTLNIQEITDQNSKNLDVSTILHDHAQEIYQQVQHLEKDLDQFLTELRRA